MRDPVGGGTCRGRGGGTVAGVYTADGRFITCGYAHSTACSAAQDGALATAAAAAARRALRSRCDTVGGGTRRGRGGAAVTGVYAAADGCCTHGCAQSTACSAARDSALATAAAARRALRSRAGARSGGDGCAQPGVGAHATAARTFLCSAGTSSGGATSRGTARVRTTRRREDRTDSADDTATCRH
jgi:hypothetical protein